MMENTPHEVDRKLPPAQTFALGLQHVLVMYSACIVVPLIVGAALDLPQDQLAVIICADLFAAGLISIIQSLGLFGFGIRLPVMMGVTFVSIAPIISIGANPELGLPGVYGAIIVSGIFGVAIAPFFGRFLRFFPPVVTGSVLLVIGISLLKVGIEWSAGGSPLLPDGTPNPDFGKPVYLLISLSQLVLVLVLVKFAKGFIANIAVLISIIAGYAAAVALGEIHLTGMDQAPWLRVVTPFPFGAPTFDLAASLAMCLVMVVTLVESTGMFLALGTIVGRPTTNKALVRGLRADGMGAVLGGVFNAFPYTSFSQNIGLVTLTGVKSRFVCAAGGFILLAMGLVPKLSHVVAATPPFVMGSAATVMFAMVAMMGIRIIATDDFKKNYNTVLIAAVSVSVGVIPLMSPQFFAQLPGWTHLFTESGVILTTFTAIALNIAFNGLGDAERAQADAADAALAVEA